MNSKWKELLKEEMHKEYFIKAINELDYLYEHESVMPRKEDLFRAFNLDIDDIKVVILGQDPYPTKGVADGLAFSTRDLKTPASLRNIFKELEDDLGIKKASNDLEGWMKQGVFLLNTNLATLEKKPLSLEYLKLSRFTDAVISLINDRCDNVVFVLWGNKAFEKEKLIDNNKHFIIKSVHPSPLSARRGFFGSKPFSQINNYLEKYHNKTIDFTK